VIPVGLLVEAHYNLGIAMVLRRRDAEAREHLVCAGRYDKNVPARVAKLGEDYVRMRQFQGAVTILGHALHLAEVAADAPLAARIKAQIQSAKQGQAYR